MPCIITYGPKNEQRACKPSAENPTICTHRSLSGSTHNVKCAIQWIDEYGNPAPDYNDAIGIVSLHGSDYPICVNHAKRLTERGMGIWDYRPLCCSDYARSWVDPSLTHTDNCKALYKSVD